MANRVGWLSPLQDIQAKFEWWSWPRTGVALSILLSYVLILDNDYLPSEASYDPKGLAAVLMPGQPGRSYGLVILALGLILACGMFRWRVLSLPSAIVFWVAAGLAESHQPGYWSHGYTFVVLAGLAYAAGITILPASLREYYAAWLAWLALSICFLNAFYFKMHEGTEWALSDNMRYQLILQYPVLGRTFPSYVQTIADHAFLYKGAALANVLTQLALGVSFLFLRRRWGRYAAAGLLVLETFALWAVMSIVAYQWYPLALLALGMGAPPPTSEAARGWRTRIVVAGLCIIPLGQVYSGFVIAEGEDYELNWYPLTQYPMYSVVYRADPEIGGVQFVVPMVGPSGDEPVSAEDLERLNSVVMRRWGHIIYASNMQEVDQFNRRLQSLCREMFGRNLPVELYYAEGLAPAPPEPAMIKWLSTTKLSDKVRSAQGG